MSEELTHGAGQDLLAAWKRAWEARDVDAFLGLFADDAEMRLDPFSDPLLGAESIRAYWNDFAARSAHTEFDAERIWVTGRSVLASWHGAATDRGTASRSRQRGFLAADLDADGHITRLRGWAGQRVVGTDSSFKPEPVSDAAQEEA